jgi:hypothetical protein
MTYSVWKKITSDFLIGKIGGSLYSGLYYNCHVYCYITISEAFGLNLKEFGKYCDM